MNERVKNRLKFLNEKQYRNKRVYCPLDVTDELRDVPYSKRTTLLFLKGIEREEPVLHGDDIFGFNRLHACLPIDNNALRTQGDIIRFSGNMTIDYASFLKEGINGYKRRILAQYEGADIDAKELYDNMLLCIDAIEKNVQKYVEFAKINGNTTLYNALQNVPLNGATSYYEALIIVKYVSYILRIANIDHVTLGRFDVYMKPYYEMSLAQGMSEEELLELTELFYIAMNLDTDLFNGIQKGDNGQSMVLGGIDESGNDVFSSLSEIALLASEELKLIDPKINLRVNKNTPLSFYERGTRLTKQGLGFPQYTNDDIAIPFLTKLGYDYEDAVHYSMAACWELITSGVGADIPNAETMNFPLVIERTIYKHLLSSNTFEQFLDYLRKEIILEIDTLVEARNKYVYYPEPLISMFINPCIERGRDHFYGGAKYRNYGIHGAGISVAADSLSALKLHIYENKDISKEILLSALKNNYEGYEDIRELLLDSPKMGNNDDYVDDLAGFIMETFSSNLNGRKNNLGGVYRAGTGSAMEYILSAAKVGATPDGRRAKDSYSSSFSPSLFVKTKGPLSAIQSFTKYDLTNISNGGPFTIELHDTVFRNSEGEKKVAMLVKTFIDLGGHQIQLNAINKEILLDAQKHPEKYPNLIVRVWGWSGYFVELETKYQNHIISRLDYQF